MHWNINTGSSLTIVWVSSTSRHTSPHWSVFADPVWPSSPGIIRLHCDTYPNHKHDQLTLLDELRNVVSFARAGTYRLGPLALHHNRTWNSDMILSEKSLSPYSTDDLSNILKLIDHLKGRIFWGRSNQTSLIPPSQWMLRKTPLIAFVSSVRNWYSGSVFILRFIVMIHSEIYEKF